MKYRLLWLDWGKIRESFSTYSFTDPGLHNYLRNHYWGMKGVV